MPRAARSSSNKSSWLTAWQTIRNNEEKNFKNSPEIRNGDIGFTAHKYLILSISSTLKKRVLILQYLASPCLPAFPCSIDCDYVWFSSRYMSNCHLDFMVKAWQKKLVKYFWVTERLVKGKKNKIRFGESWLSHIPADTVILRLLQSLQKTTIRHIDISTNRQRAPN